MIKEKNIKKKKSMVLSSQTVENSQPTDKKRLSVYVNYMLGFIHGRVG